MNETQKRQIKHLRMMIESEITEVHRIKLRISKYQKMIDEIEKQSEPDDEVGAWELDQWAKESE